MKTFTTAKGTILPLRDLHGKDYLDVKWRIVWFREEHPTWAIMTDFVSITDSAALARATILNDQNVVISTSHKYESKAGFSDYHEKAETGSIGRALALIGYGTQFCADELEEGPRIVDSPRENRPNPAPSQAAVAAQRTPSVVRPITSGAKSNEYPKATNAEELKVTEPQVRLLHATAKEMGWTKPQLHELLLADFGKESLNDLGKYKEFTDYYNFIKNNTYAAWTGQTSLIDKDDVRL